MLHRLCQCRLKRDTPSRVHSATLTPLQQARQQEQTSVPHPRLLICEHRILSEWVDPGSSGLSRTPLESCRSPVHWIRCLLHRLLWTFGGASTPRVCTEYFGKTQPSAQRNVSTGIIPTSDHMLIGPKCLVAARSIETKVG